MSEANFKSFFQKLSDNVGAALYERLSSPFFQSFVAAWIVLNWEIIYYLISSDVELDALGRIEYVRQNLASPMQILWKPLGWSFGFLFAYILLSSIGFFVWEIFQQIKRYIRGRVIGWRPVDAEDVKNLKLKVKQLDNINNDLINQFGTQRLELQNKLIEAQGDKNSLDKELSEFRKSNSMLEESLEKLQYELTNSNLKLRSYENELSNSEADIKFRNKKQEEIMNELALRNKELEKLRLELQGLNSRHEKVINNGKSWDFLNIYERIGSAIGSDRIKKETLEKYKIALAFSIDDIKLKSPDEVFSVEAVMERSGLNLFNLVELGVLFSTDSLVKVLDNLYLEKEYFNEIFTERGFKEIFKRKPYIFNGAIIYTIAEIYFSLTNEAQEKIDYQKFRSYLVTHEIIKKKY